MSPMSEYADGRGQGDPGLEFVTTRRSSILADHWGLVLTYGLFTLAIGIVLAVWPGETLTVLAVLLGIQLILMGSVRMFFALGSASLDRNGKLLVGLTGLLGLVVGVLCLMEPVQTLKAIGVLIGIF
jgi:uncharacterized membrane protein HdeD (DUF308 family)